MTCHAVSYVRPGSRLDLAYVPGHGYVAAQTAENVAVVSPDLTRVVTQDDTEIVAQRAAGRFLRAAWASFVTEQVTAWQDIPASINEEGAEQ